MATDHNFRVKNSLEVGGTVIVSSGGVSSSGNLVLRTNSTDRWEMTTAGHILPAIDNTYDIGSSSKKVRDIYVSDGSIKMGTDTVLSVNADGDFELKDASGNPKNLKIEELELGTGDNKVILKKGSDGRLESQEKVSGTKGTARKAFFIGIHNSGDISEGTNKFYTDARVASYLSTQGFATQSNVVASIVDSAPSTLDTLNELAAALGDDASFSTTVTNSIATKLPLAGGNITGAQIAFTAASNGDKKLNFSGHGGASGYNYFLGAANDGGNKAVMFVNGSTRSADGGPNTFTIRNDAGPINVGRSSQTTKLLGSGELLFNSNKVFHAGNDGSGSGLDADSVDGVPAAHIIYADNTSGSSSSHSNWNTISKSGFYTHSNASNKWSTPNYSSLIHHRLYTSNNDYATQLGFDTYNNNLYTRTNNNGTWTSWDKIWHAGVDGSGSGLDADLLDGVNGASFMRSDTADSFTAIPTFANSSNGTLAARTGFSDFIGYNANYGSYIGGGVSNAGSKYLYAGGYMNDGGTVGTLWRSTNDGSGSGLDADLLDGYHGSNYIGKNGSGYYQPNSWIDFNTTNTGLYWSGGTSAGHHIYPDGNVYMRFRSGASSSGGLRLQNSSGTTYGSVYANSSNYIGFLDNSANWALQVRNNGTIYRGNGTGLIWDSANDGSGSGLDADNLDGETWDSQTKAVAARNWTTEAGDGQGLTFWGGTGTALAGSYAIAMSSQGNGNAGRHSLDSSSDYNMYFKMSGGTDRGFVFKNSGSNVAAITSGGRFLGSAVYLDGSSSQNQYVAADSTHSLTIRNMGATAHGGLVLQGSDGTHGLQLYFDGSGANYGFLDGAWAGWDIRKVRNGAFSVDEGSGLKRVWNAGNDGSGSGLDADLLDGKDSSLFPRYRSLFGSGSNKNWNTEIADVGGTGRMHWDEVHNINTSWTNGPIATFSSAYTYGGVQSVFLGSQKYQMYVPHTAANGNGVYYRSGWGASQWYDWKVFLDSGNVSSYAWTSSNDGSGSGLDADLLDGQQGSYYLTASNFTGTLHKDRLPNFVHLGTSTTTGYATDDGSWGSRLNVSSTVHAKIEVSQEANSMRSAWYAHVGQTGIKFGTTTSHVVDFITAGSVRMSIPNNSGLVTTTGQGTLWGSSNDGAGSGLDADTVDGIDSASFLRSDTADTASGVISFTAGHGAINITNSSILSSATSSWTGNPGGAGKIQYHSNRWYIVSDSSSNRIVQFRKDGSDQSYIANNGNFVGNVTGNADTATSATSADTIDSWGFVNTGSNSAQNSDTINSNGISYYTGGVTNFSGNATDGALYSQRYSTNWQHQIAGDYRSGQIALRGKNNGTWQAWRKVWDESNDGSGSGLDADTVRGSVPSFTDTNTNFPQTGQTWTLASGYSVAQGDWGLRNTTPYGWIQFGPANTSHAHIYTNLSNFYFNVNSMYQNGHLIWAANNDGSGSGLDADLLDGKQASDFVSTHNGTNRNIQAEVGALHFYSDGGNSGQSNHSYAIFQESGAWSHPYPDLRIAFHTGIKIGGHTSYGGTRFYSNSDMATELFSVGNGDNHVRVAYNLYRGSNTVWDAGNDGSGSGLDADLLDGQQGSYYYAASNPSNYLVNTSGSVITANPYSRIHSSDGTSPDNLGHDNRYQIFNYGVSSSITGPLLSFSGFSSYPMQLTASYSGGGTGIKYRTRNGDSASWNSWYTLWHSGNDGSSSGLDADTLDGQHGSYYAIAGGTDELRAIPNRWYANANAVQTLDYYTHAYAKAHMGNTYKYTNSRPALTSDSNYWVGSMGWGNTDLNTIFSYGSGFWDSWSGPSNAPSGTTHWTGLNALHYSSNTGNSQYGMQQAMGAGNPSLFFVRGIWGGGFTSWRRIWNDGNDGSGSGLDADLLDGQHGSYYAPASSIPSVGNGTITIAAGTNMSGGGSFTANQAGNTTITLNSTASGGGGGSQTIQQVLDTGDTVSTNQKLNFRDSGKYIISETSSTFGLFSDAQIRLTCLGAYSSTNSVIRLEARRMRTNWNGSRNHTPGATVALADSRVAMNVTDGETVGLGIDSQGYICADTYEMSLTVDRTNMAAGFGGGGETIIPAMNGKIVVIQDIMWINKSTAPRSNTTGLVQLEVRQQNPASVAGNQTVGILTPTQWRNIQCNGTMIWARDVPVGGGRSYETNQATKLHLASAANSLPSTFTSLTVLVRYKIFDPSKYN